MAQIINLPVRPARRPAFQVVKDTTAPRRTVERVNTHLDDEVGRKAFATEKMREAIRVAVAVFGASRVADELRTKAEGLEILAEREARQ